VTQILVRKLDEDIKPKLKARAARHGRSLEEEVRVILREVADRSDPSAANDSAEEGLGTQIAKLFEGIGFEPGEFEPDGLLDDPVRAAVFED